MRNELLQEAGVPTAATTEASAVTQPRIEADASMRYEFIDVRKIQQLEVPAPVSLYLYEEGQLAADYPVNVQQLKGREVLYLNFLLQHPGRDISFDALAEAEMRERAAQRLYTNRYDFDMVSRRMQLRTLQRLSMRCRSADMNISAIEITETGARLRQDVAVIDARPEAIERNRRSATSVSRLIVDHVVELPTNWLESSETSEALYGKRFQSRHLPYGYYFTYAHPYDAATKYDIRNRVARKLRSKPGSDGQWDKPLGSEEDWLRNKYLDILNGHEMNVWGRRLFSTDTRLEASPTSLAGQFKWSFEGNPRIWSPNECDPTHPDGSAIYVGGVASFEPGIGAAVFSIAEDMAVEAGKDWVRIDVWTTNTRLHDYYKNLGFEVVRSHKIPGYPSCMLMQKRVAQTVNQSSPQAHGTKGTVLELPERLAWKQPSASEIDVEKWEQFIDKWTENDTSILFRPAGHSDWMRDRHGNYRATLQYDAYLSSHQQCALLGEIGLGDAFVLADDAPSLVHPGSARFEEAMQRNSEVMKTALALWSKEKSGSQRLSLVLEPRARTYEGFNDMKEQLNGNGVLLEGVIAEDGTFQFALSGGELVSKDWRVDRVYRLPSEDNKEYGLQALRSTELMPGDVVEVRLRQDEASGNMVATVLIRESGEHRLYHELEVRAQVNALAAEISKRLMAPSETIKYDGIETSVKLYYGLSLEAEEEKRLRKMLIRKGIYATDPTLVELGLIDRAYVGMQAIDVSNQLAKNVSEGGTSTLSSAMNYLYTLEPYRDAYNYLWNAILHKAEEIGCEEDLARMVYARWTRNTSVMPQPVCFGGYRVVIRGEDEP